MGFSFVLTTNLGLGSTLQNSLVRSSRVGDESLEVSGLLDKRAILAAREKLMMSAYYTTAESASRFSPGIIVNTTRPVWWKADLVSLTRLYEGDVLCIVSDSLPTQIKVMSRVCPGGMLAVSKKFYKSRCCISVATLYCAHSRGSSSFNICSKSRGEAQKW